MSIILTKNRSISGRCKLSMAPMMDRTDRHFRYFIRQITKHTLLYTEMLTSAAILNGDRKNLYVIGDNIGLDWRNQKTYANVTAKAKLSLGKLHLNAWATGDINNTLSKMSQNEEMFVNGSLTIKFDESLIMKVKEVTICSIYNLLYNTFN